MPDGGFGTFVWSLAEDGSGVLWAGAETGLWRWKPGPPKRYEMPGMRLGDLSTSDDGELLIGLRGAGLKRLRRRQTRIVPHPKRRSIRLSASRTTMSIPTSCSGTAKAVSGSEPTGLGLLHVKDGKADTFNES